MNLPDRTTPPAERDHNGSSTSDSGATPRASIASESTAPLFSTAGPTSAPMNIVPTRSNHGSSPARPPFRSRDTAPDFTRSPQTFPSSSPAPLARVGRTMSERSPSPHTRAPGPTSGSMADALNASKSPGLIRRLSRGAHQKLRRRTSHQHSLRMRDQSAGPVLVRRRSDSNGASDFGQDMSDLELDENPHDDAIEDHNVPPPIPNHANGLGISFGRSSNASSQFDGGFEPALSAVLQRGTWLTKYTKRTKKRLNLWLDPDSARVCWHATSTSKSFFIDDVRDVRVGAESRNARDGSQIPDEDEGRWLTIVYEPPERSKGRTIKTMHLVLDSEIIRSYWVEALNTVTRERTEIMGALAPSVEKSEKSMKMAWKHATKTSEEKMTLDSAKSLCRRLEINCSDSAVKTHFAMADSKSTGLLDYAQYQSFVNSFKERKDIQTIFRNLTQDTESDMMTLDAFLAFLKHDQNVDVEKERSFWEAVFDKHAKPAASRVNSYDTTANGTPAPAPQKLLNAQGFQNFLTSMHCLPLSGNKNDVVLDRPFNEYFISSSHNTYLLGRQVAGMSSVEGYISTLVKGCRCIEIDCWDGDDGQPMVTHGRTMTSKVSFEDCVSTIARYAFCTSSYPLVVSLEVHCNAEQQRAMVQLMLKYWSESIVTEPIVTNAVSLPSPEELKFRILVKVKASEEVDESQLLADSSNGRSRARSLGSGFNRAPSVDKHSVTSTPLVASPAAGASPAEPAINGSVSTPRGSTTSGPTLTPSSSAEDSEDMVTTLDHPRNRKTSKIAPELGRLGVYAQGIKFGSFSAPESKSLNHIFSFSEKTFDNLCAKESDTKALCEKHNMRHLMRVYPAARRIDSSNFNPLQVWRRGVQMAALNWQTYDVHQQVNEAMFASGSDRLGYVLKPEELRHAKHLPIADMIPEVPEKKDKKGKKMKKFTVDIISAHRLPRPRNQNGDVVMNPYVEFEMFSAEDKARGNAKGEGGVDASARDGTSGIGSPLRKRTKIVEGNGFDPIYNQSISMSVETKYPSLIFVRWTIYNAPEGRPGTSANTTIGSFTAKLARLQQGYRHLPLSNKQGEQYRDAKLFVRIKKEAPVPLQSDDSSTVAGPLEPTAASPRPDPRPERSWRSRVFSRNASERRRNKDAAADDAANGLLSRTSSMDRESMRSRE